MSKERDKKFEAKGLEKVQRELDQGLHGGVNKTAAETFIKRKLRENERDRAKQAEESATRTEAREDNKLEFNKWAIVIAGLTFVVLAISLYFSLNK